MLAKLIQVVKTGHKPGKVAFQATFEGLPLSRDLLAAQKKMGYHPLECGIPVNMKAIPLGGGKYQATWVCDDSD
jgi:hypothetical protein